MTRKPSLSIEDFSLIDFFSDLDVPSLEKDCKDFKFFELSMGEILFPNEFLPENIYLLTEGSLRIQIKNPNDPTRLITIGITEPPYIAGWSSIRASLPLEIVSAASDSKLLEISSSQLISLTHKYPSIARRLNTTITVSDTANLFSSLLHNSDLVSPRQIKDSIKYLTDHLSIVSASKLQADNDLQSFSFFICGNYSFGSHSDPLNLDNPQNLACITPESWVFKISNYHLNSFGLHSNLSTFKTSANEYPILEQSQSHLNNPNIDEIQPVSKVKENFDDFPFFDSPQDSLLEAVACFRIIAKDLNIPLKVDLLKRVLADQSKKTNGFISLQLCAAIAESLQLNTQLLKLPVNLIGRLEVPSLIRSSSGELFVALRTKPGFLLVSRPTKSVEVLSPTQLHEFSDDDNNLEVLILRTTERTKSKRFGLHWFIPAIKKNKKAFIEVLIASLFVQLFQLMNPLIIQQIIDKVIGQNGINTLPVLAVLLFSFSIFENVLTAVRTNLFIDTTNRIDISLGEQVIDHLLRLPLNYFDKKPVGELSSRLSELEKIRSFLTDTALTVVLDSVFSIIYIAVMLFYSWILTIVALLVAPLLALLTFSMSPIIRRQLRYKAELNAYTQNHLVEVLTGMHTVKAQNIELNARWKWKDRYSKYISEGFKNAVTCTTTNGLTNFLSQASSLSVVCVGSYLVLKGQLTLGQLIAFRIIAGYVTTPLLRLSNLYQSFQQTCISLERLSDIVDTNQESSDLDKANIPLPPIIGDVVFDDVSFRFGTDGPLQVSKASLSIKAGEFVAIVGQSGSGKSTLVKLLARLYSIQSGKILIDGVDINKVELYSLRRQIGIVPQDSILFDGSVQDNISLSNPEATSEQIINSAKVACAHEFIMGLPSGYATSVGERGSGLSGGQRQRIAIARTVLQDPNLLIMDEATSALDYQTEKLVSLNLMEQFRHKTVFFITHRLNSITNADKIILMHKGKIEEVGTHSDLMNLRGRYYALFNQQQSSQN